MCKDKEKDKNLELTPKEREELIREIEGLYPADAPYPETQLIGINLFMGSLAADWRAASDLVLIQYARLCRQTDLGQLKPFKASMIISPPGKKI